MLWTGVLVQEKNVSCFIEGSLIFNLMLITLTRNNRKVNDVACKEKQPQFLVEQEIGAVVCA